MKGKNTTINDYCKAHKIRMDTLYCPAGTTDSVYNSVYFVLFTNKPAFGVIVEGGEEAMKKIVENYNLNDFFNSRDFEFQLEQRMPGHPLNKTHIRLTDLWMVEHLGNPSDIKKYVQGNYESKEYTYNSYSIILTFINGIFTSYYRY
jgi:hypothetical protein